MLMQQFDFISFPKFPFAQCVGLGNQDFFFPNSQVELEQRLPTYKELCGRCIHQSECLTYALDNEIFEGIWAGTTPDQRKALWLKQHKEERRNKRFREIQYYLSIGFTKEEVAKKLDIKVTSLERTLDRAKRRGLL